MTGVGVPVPLSEIKPEDRIYYEMAVTDSGHARMLTGERCLKNGVAVPYNDANNLIDYLCANNFELVNDGMTIMEKIEAKDPSVFTGVIASRHGDMRDLIGKGYVSVFLGWGKDRIYMPVGGADAIGGHSFYSTTFLNSIPDLDFFFDSRSIPKSQVASHVRNSYFYSYDPSTGRIVSVEELKDDFIAARTAEQIAGCVRQQSRFFLFVHFCEPDLFGHFYGENSGEYSLALISNDYAVGRIVGELKRLGVYDETLLIVTTDHGATEGAPSAATVTVDGKKWLETLGLLHGALTEENHSIWMINNKYHFDHALEQIHIVPLILGAMGF